MAGIILVINDRSGILAKVSVALVRANMHVTKRTSEKTDDGLVKYIFTVDSINSKTLATIEDIKKIEGVVEITPTKVSPVEGLQATEWSTINELKFGYPDIVGIVQDYSASINQEEAPSRVYGLGYTFGSFIAKSESTKSPKSVTALCDDITINSISQFCMAERTDNRLIVTLCPFCRDSPEHIHNCNFLHGFISGNINAFPEWSNVKVLEVSSQAGGADQCVFDFNIVNQ